MEENSTKGSSSLLEQTGHSSSASQKWNRTQFTRWIVWNSGLEFCHV